MYFLVYQVDFFHMMLGRCLLCSSVCGPGLIEINMKLILEHRQNRQCSRAFTGTPTTYFFLLFSYVFLGLPSGLFPHDVGKVPSVFVCMWARPNRNKYEAYFRTQTEQTVFTSLYSATCTDVCLCVRSWYIPLPVVGFSFISFPLVPYFSWDYYYGTSSLWQLIKMK